MSPEIEAAIIKVAGNWALAMAERDVRNKKAKNLSSVVYGLFKQDYSKLHKAIEKQD